MVRFLVLDGKDNVAVALEPAKAGDQVSLSSGGTMQVKQDIPFAHKIAIKALKVKDQVIKYGEIIGEASAEINPGDHVHVHNIRSLRGETGGKK